MEEIEFEDKKELFKRERHYIESIESTVNKYRPITTTEEKKQHKYDKEHRKKYIMDNKDKIRARQNERCICECGHSYTRAHKAEHMKSKRHMKTCEKVINITINITCKKVEICRND